MNRNYKDIAIRAAKTFVQSFMALTTVAPDNIATVALIGAVSALQSALMNLFNISPTSLTGRAAATFVQTFVAVFASNAYSLDEATVVAAVSAGISAVMNLMREAIK